MFPSTLFPLNSPSHDSGSGQRESAVALRVIKLLSRLFSGCLIRKINWWVCKVLHKYISVYSQPMHLVWFPCTSNTPLSLSTGHILSGLSQKTNCASPWRCIVLWVLCLLSAPLLFSPVAHRHSADLSSVPVIAPRGRSPPTHSSALTHVGFCLRFGNDFYCFGCLVT